MCESPEHTLIEYIKCILHSVITFTSISFRLQFPFNNCIICEVDLRVSSEFLIYQSSTSPLCMNAYFHGTSRKFSDFVLLSKHTHKHTKCVMCFARFSQPFRFAPSFFCLPKNTHNNQRERERMLFLLVRRRRRHAPKSASRTHFFFSFSPIYTYFSHFITCVA